MRLIRRKATLSASFSLAAFRSLPFARVAPVGVMRPGHSRAAAALSAAQRRRRERRSVRLAGANVVEEINQAAGDVTAVALRDVVKSALREVEHKWSARLHDGNEER